MPKSKRARTLLEVIDRGTGEPQKGFSAPRWWKSKPQEPAQPSERVDLPASEVTAAPAAMTVRMGPWRIRPVTAVVVVGGLIIAAFIIIQSVSLRDRDKPEPDLLAGQGGSIEELRDQPPREDALDVLLARTRDRDAGADAGLASADLPPETSGGDSGTAGAARPLRQSGLNYVIVESFRGDRAAEDAQEACNYLRSKGIETSVERVGPSLCLVTLEGFAARDPRMSDLCRRIEQLGQAYFAAGGKYRFKGCYGKLYSSTGW